MDGKHASKLSQETHGADSHEDSENDVDDYEEESDYGDGAETEPVFGEGGPETAESSDDQVAMVIDNPNPVMITGVWVGAIVYKAASACSNFPWVVHSGDRFERLSSYTERLNKLALLWKRPPPAVKNLRKTRRTKVSIGDVATGEEKNEDLEKNSRKRRRVGGDRWELIPKGTKEPFADMADADVAAQAAEDTLFDPAQQTSNYLAQTLRGIDLERKSL